ncbi:MAG TPA: SDR family NAD(P)-dependent oxidoreductase [Rhizomicrobium sp.]|nr:SDR family NAD(P)-dependent oxidoreductase [Rhizomicrobium sp.]
MKDVRGGTAFVTGGASGIGLGIARALGQAGAKVALCDIDFERAAEAAETLRAQGADCLAVALDVTCEESWRAAATDVRARLGEVTVLCNTAGVGGGSGLAESYAPEVWRQVHSTNVDSLLFSVRTFVPGMRAGGRACHIVNTASMAGVVAPPNAVSYVSSKFAVTGFTLALRNELGGSRIGISLLCPGMTRTRIVETTQSLRPGAAEMGVGAETAAAMNAVLATGMNPDSVGRAVLDAILRDRLFIFTHPEWKVLAEERFAEMLEGFGPSAEPGYCDDISQILSGLAGTRSGVA